MEIYGIKNCNTVKKALAWLNEHNIAYTFHDFKKEGVTSEKLQQWINQTGWQLLVNKRGTTWRKLTQEEQESIQDEQTAIRLMQEKTSVIKRPVIEYGNNNVLLGFDEQEYKNNLI